MTTDPNCRAVPPVRGTAADRPFCGERRYPFGSAAGLLRWFLGPGRAGIEARRAIDYEAVRVGCDAWAVADKQIRFAWAARAMRGLDPADLLPRGLLVLAYGPGTATRRGESDAAIARALRCSDVQVARRRRAALRSVRERAVAMGLIEP